MKLFACQACGQPLDFENTHCERCKRRLGFDPGRGVLVALDPREGSFSAADEPARRYRFCANAAHEACNWLLGEAESGSFCRACRHNRTIPNLGDLEHAIRWRRLEAAKHRLFYSLLALSLPLVTRAEDPAGLAFDFLADPAEGTGEGPSVLTGHDEGLITLVIAEADDAERERRRRAMGEPYRTLLGHFRHEVGHYYWDRLIRDDPSIDAFRALFGDERADYGEALKAHYANGPKPDWQEHFVSAYAASHPWEDFAETFAHYLHMVDTLETAGAFGVRVAPPNGGAAALESRVDFDPYGDADFARLAAAWGPIAFAANALNRSMGQPDLYPFVLSPPVLEKLRFIHDRVHGR
ncbi:MAG TPA: putative zinc-binding peptidase [Microvirga sp.]|jgi:hypothetical protein